MRSIRLKKLTDQKERIVIYSVLFLFIFISIGYSYLYTALSINGNVTVSAYLTAGNLLQKMNADGNTCITKYIGQVTDQVGQTVPATNVYFDKCADKRHIVFNDMCWQVIRTTETGGLKVVYDGEPDQNGQCGTSRSTHKGIVSDTYGSFAHYFYGLDLSEEYPYATSFTYDTTNNTFTLVNPIRATWNENLLGKFSCLDDTNTCSELYYMSFYVDPTDAYLVGYQIGNTNYAGIGKSTFNAFYASPTYSGYMFNKPYDLYDEPLISGALMGNDVSYSNGTYTLLPAQGESVLGTTKDATHHYTCNNTTGTCNKVRYYHTSDYYVELDGEANIDEVLNIMLYGDDVNHYNSSIKGIIDSWYAQNMTSKTNMLEDTVFCNARNMINPNSCGWNPNGQFGHILFKNETGMETDMTCFNLTDQFAISNNKAKLTYPVGIISAEEVLNINTPSLMATGEPWYSLSPSSFAGSSTNIVMVDSDGSYSENFVGIAYGVRPVVSLASNVGIESGTGSTTDPWIVDD